MQKKHLIYFLIAILILSCKSKKENKTPDCFSPEMQINYDFIKNEIENYKAGFKTTDCDIKTIKMHFNTNHFKGIMAIALNEIVIRNCIKELSSKDKEKAFSMFKEEMLSVIELLNGQLYNDYEKLYQKLEIGKADNEVKSFKKSLEICGMELATSEGTFYVDETYYYLYKLFKNKVSPQLDEFLSMRSMELRQGYSDDAVLTISYDELYDRIINWEDFQIKNPDFFLKQEVEDNLKLYLSTMLTGIDNTPVFDYDTQILLPEIKNIYEKVIAKNDNRKSTEIITKYYNLLKEKEFKQNDDIDRFMKENKLYYTE